MKGLLRPYGARWTTLVRFHRHLRLNDVHASLRFAKARQVRRRLRHVSRLRLTTRTSRSRPPKGHVCPRPPRRPTLAATVSLAIRNIVPRRATVKGESFRKVSGRGGTGSAAPSTHETVPSSASTASSSCAERTFWPFHSGTAVRGLQLDREPGGRQERDVAAAGYGLLPVPHPDERPRAVAVVADGMRVDGARRCPPPSWRPGCPPAPRCPCGPAACARGARSWRRFDCASARRRPRGASVSPGRRT